MVAETASNVRGFLQLSILEASGRNKNDTFVWDNNSFQGFVKAELRGGEKPVKAQTGKVDVEGTSITWKEDLTMEVQEGANELRLMLCREKTSTTENKKGVVVLAACGIYVNDIIDAVPIDKYFELFKPTQGGEGGYIRVRLNFSVDGQFPASPEANGEAGNVVNHPARLSFAGYTAGDLPEEAMERLPTVPEEIKPQRGIVKKVGLLAAAAAAVVVAKVLASK
eukprot:TRINITY_DN739_c0_g2_i1.p3 TRINITY_DN739_c0_g2~~TRINITY_DN739_c0_g2_i1.p3  ORF type:complete len:224 (-),score=43.12 TRINITY_DN739_c0_g2_i1:795-1466(-)